MRNLLFTLTALLMASTAMADSYLYMDDMVVQGGQEITVPIKASFDARLNAFQLDVTYPEGVTPVSMTAGTGLNVTYLNAAGIETTATPVYGSNEVLSRFVAAYSMEGYWSPNGDGQYESYGAVKWEPGTYEDMIQLTLNVEEGFSEGDIILESQVASGEDARGGTVRQNGDHMVLFTRVCHISVKPEPQPVDGDYMLTMDDAEVLCGKTVVIPVSMTNAELVTAFQTDLYLPEGFELQDVVLSSRKRDHNLMYSTREDGAVRILCYSPSLSSFGGYEGELFNITVSVPDDAAGDYTLELKKSLLTIDSYAEVQCENTTSTLHVKTFTPGDVNGDGQVTVTDVVLTAQYILDLNPEPFILEAADMTGDGEITVTDLVLITRIILDPNYIDLMYAPARGENHDAMSGQGINLSVGETRTVAIVLDNEVDYTAFQLDLQLPDGLTASNFSVTDRAGSHTLNTSVLDNGKQRVMCYSPALATIAGNKGTVLTFDVTASCNVGSDIMVDGIEMVGADYRTVYLDSFAIGVNSSGVTAVKEMADALRIYTDGHDIIVESPVAQSVAITDLVGRSYTVNVIAGRNVIPARTSGVVIVTAGDKSAKLMVNE